MEKLNKKLFWDVNFKDIDYKKHANFIIKRILIHGGNKDYKWIQRQYGARKIKEVAKKTSFSSRKNLNFWSLIFNIPLKSFKCVKKLSTKKQSIFSRR